MYWERCIHKWKWIIFFLAPSLAGMFLFILYPMDSSLGVALTDWTLPRQANFIGIETLQRLMVDPDFLNAVRITLIFIALYVPVVFILGLMLALFLNQKVRGMIVVRMATFMPVVASWVVVSLIWRWIFNPSYGLINGWLSIFGIQGPQWLYQPDSALVAVVITTVWKDIGYIALLYLGGLQGMADTYYEAARIDGANRFHLLRYITIPLLTPTMFFVVITLIINYFQMFDAVYLMPVKDTAAERNLSVIVVEVVENAISYNRMGYASAMSWALFGLIFVVTIIQLRVQKRWVYYEVE
jgi:multiple sugar transport system permease protein